MQFRCCAIITKVTLGALAIILAADAGEAILNDDAVELLGHDDQLVKFLRCACPV